MPLQVVEREEEPKLAAADILWQRLEIGQEVVSPANITEDFIEDLRRDIKQGRVAPMIETDYKAGYYLYAKGEIARLLNRRRQYFRCFDARRYFPLPATEPGEKRVWIDGITSPSEQADHSLYRRDKSISSAAWHSCYRVASGQSTWNAERAAGHQAWDAEIDKAEQKMRKSEDKVA